MLLRRSGWRPVSAPTGHAGADRSLLRRRFGRAAAGYGEAAVVQREVASRLLDGLERLPAEPSVIVDAGAGPGETAGRLRRRFGKAQVLALDLALPMLRLARRQGGFWRPLPAVCADIGALPLVDASVDLLYSNLALHWLDDIDAVLAGFQRVLRPDGLLLLACFGPQTLIELRQAWAAADDRPHVHEFPDMAALGDALMARGFRDPVLDRDLFTLSHDNLDGLLADLRRQGMANARRDRHRGLAGKVAWQRMRAFHHEHFQADDGQCLSTLEVIYVHALAPAIGQPRRSGSGEVATIPVSAIRRRRK